MNETADLRSIFNRLVQPLPQPADNRYAAVEIPGLKHHRLAKDSNGAPCLLLHQEAAAAVATPIILENLRVLYNVTCAIVESNGAELNDVFTIVRCSPRDSSLFPYFLSVLSPIVASMSATPSQVELRRAISRLVDLFRSISSPPLRTIQGLWGELFVIAKATDINGAVSAWHKDPRQLVDFAVGDDRVEIKSAGNRLRVHHFSLTQLTPPMGARLTIISLFTERSGGGRSLRSLYEGIRGGLGSNFALLVEFDSTFFGSLGASWEDAMEESFDEQLANESLQFFSCESVPKVDLVPLGVADVRFTSDLSTVPPISRDGVRSSGGLLAALVPRA